MQLLRTFFGFLGGAIIAALALQLYRTGRIDFSALFNSLSPVIVGSGAGLLLVILVLIIFARKR
jgi:predicted membrane protein